MSRDYIGLNPMKQSHHPPYSSDFASSNFSLFGHVKRKLMEYRAEIPSELLVLIRVILAKIPQEILNAVFLEWMDGSMDRWTERLQKCVQVDGEYIG
jgi:hypothetical protein